MLGSDDSCDPQVDPGEFVDGDGGRASVRLLRLLAGDMRLLFAVALLRRSRLARRLHLGRGERVLVGLQQRVDLLALDAGHEVLVGLMVWPAGSGSQTFVQASGAIARKPSTFAANAGRTGFK